VRRRLLEIAGDALERLVVVDERALEVAGEEIARDAQRQLGLLVDELGRARGLRLRLDRLPQALEEHEVALDVLLRRAFGGGADDDAALLDVQLAQDLLQAPALVVVEAARHAEALALRDEDDEAARQRDLRRQPRALRLHRVLHRLDEDRLPAGDQVLDAAAVAALELGADDLVDVQEAVLLEADLDERGLHAREHVVDRAEVDVAGDRAALRPLEVHLGDAVVLEHGDALLADVDRDEQLALRRGERRAARRLAAAAALLAAALLPLRELLRRLLGRLLPLLLALGLLGRFCRLLSGRPLAPAPAAAAATALGLGGIGCVGRVARGRLDYFGLGESLGCGLLSGRDVGFVLPSTEPGQEKAPSFVRATPAATWERPRVRCRSGMKTIAPSVAGAPSDPGPTIPGVTTREVRS
jgi:hypothetical protein